MAMAEETTLRDLDVTSMSNDALLQSEKEMYEKGKKCGLKKLTRPVKDAISACNTFGVSLLFSIPAAKRNKKLRSYYAKQRALCVEEIERRGMKPLDKSFTKIAVHAVGAVVFDAILATIPFGGETCEAAMNA